MNTGFKEILISHRQTDFADKLSELRSKILQSARWPDGDERYDQLRSIMVDVAGRGDEAVREFTAAFDGIDLEPSQFRLPPEDLETAYRQIDKDLLSSLGKAIDNVKEYQREIFTGASIAGRIKYTPIRRVGLCVPGASAPLPSTVIMTAVPAIVAGVKEIAVVSPPRYQGTVHPVILAVCRMLGIEEVYRIGGAQAVAALAFGTDTVGKVYKIAGPGSTWVQMAKREVFGSVDIDSIAGPSEVLIVANDRANPAWVATDMLSQAEHDPGSAMVFTDSQQLADKIIIELEHRTPKLDRAQGAARCLREYGGIVVFENLDDAVCWANDFAPEHLQILCAPDSDAVAEKIENAGAIFIGEYCPVAVGDYWAGPSHTLPTGMAAKYLSALTSNDFVKSSSIIACDKQKLLESADDIIRLAMTEGLDAHAKSIDIRRQS